MCIAWLPALFFSALLWPTTPALAADPPPPLAPRRAEARQAPAMPAAPPPDALRPRRQGMMIAGIVLTATGSAVLVGGGLGAGLGGGYSLLSLIATVPVSVGLAAVGVPLWVVGAGAAPPRPPASRRTGMMVTGIVLTAVSAALLASGAVVFAAHPPNDASPVYGIVSMPSSAVVAAVGAPLWSVGAGTRSASTNPAMPIMPADPGSGGIRLTF